MTISEIITTKTEAFTAENIEQAIRADWNSVPDDHFDNYYSKLSGIAAEAGRRGAAYKRKGQFARGERWRFIADRVERHRNRFYLDCL